MPIDTPSSTSIESGRATTVEVVQSTRRMNFLTVHENELDTISAFTAQATVFYSLSSASASACITLIAGAIYADKLSDTGKAISWIGIPLFAVLCIAFVIMARSVKTYKDTNIGRIKNESKSL